MIECYKVRPAYILTDSKLSLSGCEVLSWIHLPSWSPTRVACDNIRLQLFPKTEGFRDLLHVLGADVGLSDVMRAIVCAEGPSPGEITRDG